MEQLRDLITSHEDWLVDRVLIYAKDHGYTKYTSTLREAWRTSIAGLSEKLSHALATHHTPLEFSPEIDYANDALSAFGVLEAQRHRSRGVSLEMFLSLMKYYRQSYLDLIETMLSSGKDQEQACAFVLRFFDWVELGFISEWLASSAAELNKELQESNRFMTNEKNKYLTIFESLSNPVVFLDADCRVVNVNSAAAELFRDLRIPGAAYYGDSFRNERLPWLDDKLKSFLNSKQVSVTYETTLQIGEEDGYYQVSFRRMLDVSEKFSGVVVILNDLTARKKALTALERSEQTARALLNATLESAMLLTAEGTVLAANDPAGALLQLAPDRLLKRNVFSLLPTPVSTLIEALWESAVSSGEPVQAEKQYERKYYEINLYPVLEHGQVSRVAVFFRNVTQRKEAELAMLETERKDAELKAIRMAAMTSAHEINNPLMGITGTLQVLQESELDPETRQLVVEALEASKRIRSVVGEMENMKESRVRAYTDKHTILDLSKDTSPPSA